MKGYLSFLSELTDLADDIAMFYFRQTHVDLAGLRVSYKSDKTPVTVADQEIETKVRARVAQCFPEMVVVGEEFGGGDGSVRLIIDPIDGTKNFMAGIPFFGSLMAIEVDGVLVAAMVSLPRYKERWWAEKEKGSYNSFAPELALKVSQTFEIEKSTGFHSSFSGEKKEGFSPLVMDLLNRTWRQRGYGDFIAHMLVASGAGDFALDCQLGVWDMAPLKLIVEEAGGCVTNWAGVDSLYTGTILSSNGVLHPQLVQSLSH